MEKTTPKTTAYNLIILDESGSMRHLTRQTIEGCNETINVARHTARTHAATMRSLLSIYAFQNGGPVTSRYIVKNVAAEDEVQITDKDYQPYGNTPLLDAVGSTLSELKAVTATMDDTTGIITIITDGMENSSEHYNIQQVQKLITEFREKGWAVNLIGANIDVDNLADAMGIKTRMAWVANEEDTIRMHTQLRKSMACWSNNVSACAAPNLSKDELIELRKKVADNLPF